MLPNLSGLSCLPCASIGVALSDDARAAQQAMMAAQQAMMAAEAKWKLELGSQECGICLGLLSEPAPQRDGAHYPLPQGGVPLVLQTCVNNHWTHGACQLFAYQLKTRNPRDSDAVNEANRRVCTDCRAPLLPAALAALGIEPRRPSASSAAIDPESAASLRQRADAARVRERNEAAAARHRLNEEARITRENERAAARVTLERERAAEREQRQVESARAAEERRAVVESRRTIEVSRSLRADGSPWNFTGMPALAEYLYGLLRDWKPRLDAIYEGTPELSRMWRTIASETVGRVKSLAVMARKGPENIARFTHNKFVKQASMLWYDVKFALISVRIALRDRLFLTTAALDFSCLMAEEINTNLTARISEVYPPLKEDVLGWDPEMKELFSAQRGDANWDFVQQIITMSIAELQEKAPQVAEYEANYVHSEPPEPAT